MSKHYAGAEIEAVHEFAWQNRDQVKGFGSATAARRLLNRIAPAIAARALREAADEIQQNRNARSAPGQAPGTELVSPVFLRNRADEIEAGR